MKSTYKFDVSLERSYLGVIFSVLKLTENLFYSFAELYLMYFLKATYKLFVFYYLMHVPINSHN